MHDFSEIKKRYELAIKSTQKLYSQRREKDTAGSVRSKKGGIVEGIAHSLVEMAWKELGGNPNRLKIDRKKTQVRSGKDVYRLSQDLNVYVDGKFVASIECKAYAEIAMYKRVLMDAFLLHKTVPSISRFFLVQLENFMNGDFGKKTAPEGSPQVRVLNKFFPELNVGIITLLDGDRSINKPIHRLEFYKPLKDERLEYALSQIIRALAPYAKSKSK